MEGRLKDCQGVLNKNRRANTIVGCMVLILVIAAAGFILTKDKAQQADSKDMDVKVENEGCEEMDTNKLLLDKYPAVTEAVHDYYARLAENTDFVESYNNIQVYTKLGKYEDTYVAFARYDMKIKDIYTEVPGLGTLYIEKNKESGKMHVASKVEDEETQEFIKKIAAHEDVKELMEGIQTDYANAVASDALLEEALKDLENASSN